MTPAEGKKPGEVKPPAEPGEPVPVPPVVPESKAAKEAKEAKVAAEAKAKDAKEKAAKEAKEAAEAEGAREAEAKEALKRVRGTRFASSWPGERLRRNRILVFSGLEDQMNDYERRKTRYREILAAPRRASRRRR